MINKITKLNQKIFKADIEQKPTRDGYGSFIEFYKKTVNAVILCVVFFIITFLFINTANAASIKDDVVGGDCGSIGNWDGNTKTCLLTTDLNDSITIDGNGITLDGANHQIVGNNMGSGITIDFWKNIVIKNLKIQNFASGIYISNSENNLITENIVSDNSETGVVLSNSHGNIIIENIISNNQISGLEIWYVIPMSDNKIYRNNFINNGYQIYAMLDGSDSFFQSPPIGGNYWSDFDEPIEGCLDSNSDNFCDFSYVFDENGQDSYPWTKQNGWKISQNQPPTISNFNQYKSDGETKISENGVTTENSVIFKANIIDPDGDDVKMEIELRRIDEFSGNFINTSTASSTYVASGATSTITVYGLLESQYHWQVRAIDNQGNASAWQEFGTSGNVDFEVKLVPLYTQMESQYPPRAPKDEWAESEYARGSTETYFCGSKIKDCGCAITSAVMIARYYDVLETQGNDVNPGTINEWLKNELGGYVNGDINWIAVARYTNWGIKYEKTSTTTNDYALIDNKLSNNQPVIAKANSGRGGIGRQHFFVIDNKLASTYGVKDPAWYNTKNLADNRTDNYIRNYENGFDGLRIYKKGDGIAQSAITFALGSPAELLITDSLGRKLGKDASGIEYNEIPNASYFEDGFDAPFGENPLSQERNKLIQILEPIDGEYQLQVIGTGSGTYTLDFLSYNEAGEPTDATLEGITNTGVISNYAVNYSGISGEISEIERVITIKDAIEDVKTSYELGWITKEFVKNILIIKLKVAQRLEEEKEKQLKHFDELIEKAKNPVVKQKLEKVKKKYEEAMNKAITALLQSFIKEVEFYHKKGFINNQAKELLTKDAQYIIEHL